MDSKTCKSESKNEDCFENLKFLELRKLKTLCSGSFGQVDIVRIRDDSTRTFALKRVKKASLTKPHQRRHMLSEGKVLTEANSPFIVKLFKTFKDTKYLYMLMEVCLGGDLWSLMRHKRPLTKNHTQFYVACVLEAFGFLHSRNIAYRDLKLENLLLDHRGYLKLCDFGFAKKLEEGGKTNTFCGTPHYVSPEVIQGSGHDIRTDCWSLGVLLFELLSGKPPFDGRGSQKVYDAVLQGTDFVKFPKHFGKNTVDLFKKLCRKDPGERLGIREIRQHQWFSDFDFVSLVRGTLVAPYIPPIKNNCDTRNFTDGGVNHDDEPAVEDFSDWDDTF